MAEVVKYKMELLIFIVIEIQTYWKPYKYMKKQLTRFQMDNSRTIKKMFKPKFYWLLNYIKRNENIVES
jgi:hypothetical protein